MNRSVWAAALALVFLLAAAGLGYRYLAPKLMDSTTEAVPLDASGTPAPDFSMLDSDGHTVSLSELIDRPVILNFWATWCPPCQSELPDFETVCTRYGGQVRFLMVNITDGTRDTVASVTTFVKDQGYAFPVYFDTTGSSLKPYGLSAIPMTVAIRADGTLAWSQVGAVDADTLEAVIQSLLSE